MANDVTADTLMRQAPGTVQLYLGRAIEDIDREFGEGYAKAHPDLVGAYLHACAADYGAAIIAREITNSLEELGHTIGAHLAR